MDPLASQAALAASAVIGVLLAASIGCGESTSAPLAPSCTAYQPPAGFDGRTPRVSLRADVMPIFAQHCASTACHGSTRGGNNGVYLGAEDPSRVASETTTQASITLPSMSIVKPGDPSNSFLMHKLDGDLCTLQRSCEGGDCLDPMPKGKPLLDEAQRLSVRRWITQGAKDD